MTTQAPKLEDSNDIVRYIEGAFANPLSNAYERTYFLNQLRNIKPILLTVADFPPKDATQRQKLQNSKLDPSFIGYVQSLSDILNLSEAICEKWVRVAIARHNQGDIVLSAFQYFRQDKINLLVALLTLIKGTYTETSDPQVQDLLNQFLMELLEKDNLVGILLDQLTRFWQMYDSMKGPYDELCWLIVQSIFYVFRQINFCQFKDHTLVHLLNTLRELSSKSQAMPDNKSLFQNCVYLLLSFVNVVLDAEDDKKQKNTKLNEAAIGKIIKENWQHAQIQSVLGLVWELHENKDNKAISLSTFPSIQNGALTFVKGTLENTNIIHDKDNLPELCNVVNALVCGVIDILDLLYVDTRFGGMQQSNRELDLDEVKITILQVLTELFKLDPSTAEKFCQEVIIMQHTPSLITSHSLASTHAHRLNSFIRAPFGHPFPHNVRCFQVYVQMLTSMAKFEPAALYIFELLQHKSAHHHAAAAGASSRRGATRTGISAHDAAASAHLISWEHFISALRGHVDHFKHQIHSNTEAIHFSEAEEHNLVIILHLIEQVCVSNVVARIQMCENHHWSLLQLLFDLISCHIPPSMKAAAVRILAAFALSSDLAQKLWPYLESPRYPSRSTTLPQRGGAGLPEHGLPTSSSYLKLVDLIKQDLDQIEAATRTFPYTLAFLQLLVNLLQPEVVLSLNVSHYLEFVVQVFLKFRNLDYQYPQQKWELAQQTLTIIHTTIRATPNFPITGETSGSVNTPLLLLRELLNGTNNALYTQLLWIIKQAEKFLKQQRTEELYGETFEKATLLAIQVLKTSLEQENQVREYFSKQNLSTMSGILFQNGASILTVCSFVNYPYNIQLIQEVMYVIILLSQSRANHRSGVTVSPLTLLLKQQNIRKHFYQILQQTDDSQWKQIKESILQLLLLTHKQGVPTLCHYLLHFNVDAPMKEMNRLNIHKTESNCLKLMVHQLLENANHHTLTPTAPTVVYQTTPRLFEMYYHLLHELCADKYTSQAVLQYLRGSEADFFHRQLSGADITLSIVWPFSSPSNINTTTTTNNATTTTTATLPTSPLLPRPNFPLHQSSNTPRTRTTSAGGSNGGLFNIEEPYVVDERKQLPSYLLQQRCWLLKIIAIEIHTNATQRKRSSKKLLDFLLNTSSSAVEIERSASTAVFPHNTLSTAGDFQHRWDSDTTSIRTSRMKLIELIDSIWSIALPESLPELPYTNLLEIRPEQFSTNIAPGLYTIDVEFLRETLFTTLKRLEAGNEPSSARRSISWTENRVQKVRELLDAVVQRNLYNQLIYDKLQLFFAWKQIVEVSFHEYFDDYIRSLHPKLPYDLLELLLPQLALQPENIACAVSNCVLTLMCKLHQLFHFHGSGSGTHFGPGGDLPLTKLHWILQGLIRGLLANKSTQQTRGNLYSSLFHYLGLTRYQLDQLAVLQASKNHEKMWWLTEELEANQRLIFGNIDILEHSGHENLMEVICQDASDSAEVWRTTAFGLLNSLLSYDRKQAWLRFLEQRGFLRHFIDDVIQQDNLFVKQQQLQADQPSQLASPETILREVYVYEAKMSLFLHLAQTVTGASKLISNKLVLVLSECQAIRWRPDINTEDMFDHTLSPFITRYYQLLSPILEVICCLLDTLPTNTILIEQVLTFVRSHFDLFQWILLDRSPVIVLQSLKLLKWTALIFYRLSSHQELMEQSLQSKARKVRGWLLDLLSKYLRYEDMWKMLSNKIQYLSTESYESTPVDLIKQLTFGICQNLIAYARSVSFSKLRPLLFSFQTDRPDHQMGLRNINPESQPPSIGLLIKFLQNCMNELTAFQKLAHEHQDMLVKSNNLSAEELKQLGIPTLTTTISEHNYEHVEQQRMAQLRLQELLSNNFTWISNAHYTIEHVLTILWLHLDFAFNSFRASGGAQKRLSTEELARLRNSAEIRTLQTSLPLIPPLFEETMFVSRICEKLEVLLHTN